MIVGEKREIQKVKLRTQPLCVPFRGIETGVNVMYLGNRKLFNLV